MAGASREQAMLFSADIVALAACRSCDAITFSCMIPVSGVALAVALISSWKTTEH
jgi:hypothetical protein